MNNRRNELIIASAKKYCKCTVQGKTIRVNQLVQNGNFEDSSSWSLYSNTYASLSIANNKATVTITTSGGANYTNGLKQSMTINANHKYFVTCYFKNGNVDTRIKFEMNSNEGVLTSFNANEGKTISALIEIGNTIYENAFLIFPFDTNAVGYSYEISNVQIIDLTALGLDNVSSVSDFYQTDIGKLVRKGVYLETSDGAFMHSNTPINFIGRNIWDEQWENCYYHEGQNGQKVEYNGTVGCANQIKVYPNTTYCFSTKTPYYFYVLFYDENGDYLSDYVYNYGTKSFTTPINCHYITFYIANATYNHDICINEFDSAFNGKYQPYCGVSTFRNGFRLMKGDTYKSWTLSDIWYNNYLEEGDFPSSNSWVNNGLSSSFADGVMTLVTSSAYQSVYHDCVKTSGHKYMFLVYARNVSGISSFAFGWHSSVSSDISITSSWQLYGYLAQISGSSPYAYIYPRGVGTAQFKHYMIIDLTQLGLDNITSVEEFLNTSLGVYIQNYGYLPYTTTNETTTEQKDQLVRTMALVDLENDLTWYVDTQLTNKVVWYSDEYIQDDFSVKIPSSRYETPNGLCEKGRLISYDDMEQGNCEVGDVAIDSYGTVYVVTSSDQVEPTGNLLLELTTPQNITSYRVISGGHPISVDVVSQLVARNTIKVESANDIELDFTKE